MANTRIVIADDNPAIIDIFSELLRRESYEVWGALSGNEALNLVREKQSDVVILDEFATHTRIARWGNALTSHARPANVPPCMVRP